MPENGPDLLTQLQVPRFLAAHYGETLGWKFYADNTPYIAPDEVFHPMFMLPLFVEIAEKECEELLGIPLGIHNESDESRMMKLISDFDPKATNSASMCFLLQAVERVCGEPIFGREVNLQPVYEYLTIPPSERKLKDCPWKRPN